MNAKFPKARKLMRSYHEFVTVSLPHHDQEILIIFLYIMKAKRFNLKNV